MSKSLIHARSSARKWGGTSEDHVAIHRDIAEQHILEDLGHIPSLGDWLREMPPQPRMAGARKLPIRILD